MTAMHKYDAIDMLMDVNRTSAIITTVINTTSTVIPLATDSQSIHLTVEPIIVWVFLWRATYYSPHDVVLAW